MTDPENYLNPPDAAQEESRYETLAVKRGPKLTATMERLHREDAGKSTINPVYLKRLDEEGEEY